MTFVLKIVDGQLEDSSDLTDAGFVSFMTFCLDLKQIGINSSCLLIHSFFILTLKEADEMKLAMDIDPNDVYMDDPISRDLSAWRVSIPRVESRHDVNHKTFYVFMIDVQRIDVSDKGLHRYSDLHLNVFSSCCIIIRLCVIYYLDNPDELHWVVERQYLEFYVLESKLTEFHGNLLGISRHFNARRVVWHLLLDFFKGEFVDIHLPSRRSFGSKGLEYMESRRAAFEEFLQVRRLD